MSMHDERWIMAFTEAGEIRLRDLKTGDSPSFTGTRALYDALGVLTDWREGGGNMCASDAISEPKAMAATIAAGIKAALTDHKSHYGATAATDDDVETFHLAHDAVNELETPDVKAGLSAVLHRRAHNADVGDAS